MDLGIPTRGDKQGHFYKKHGAGVWSAAMVRHILINETYIGTWYYGKTKMIDDGKKRKPKPKCGFGKQVARERNEWIGVPVPVIIDEETYNRANARIKLNAEQSDRSIKHQYLLGRRLKCMKCNYTYKGRTRKNNHYDYCGGTEQRPVRVCDAPPFKGRDLDRAVREWLVSLSKNPRAVLDGLQDTQDEVAQENQVLIDRLDMIERFIGQEIEIAGNESSLEQISRAYQRVKGADLKSTWMPYWLITRMGQFGKFLQHIPSQESRTDIASLRSLYPDLKNLENGLRAAKPMSAPAAPRKDRKS